MGGRFINRETQTVDNLSPPLPCNNVLSRWRTETSTRNARSPFPAARSGSLPRSTCAPLPIHPWSEGGHDDSGGWSEIGQRGPRFPFESMNRFAGSLWKIDPDSVSVMEKALIRSSTEILGRLFYYIVERMEERREERIGNDNWRAWVEISFPSVKNRSLFIRVDLSGGRMRRNVGRGWKLKRSWMMAVDSWKKKKSCEGILFVHRELVICHRAATCKCAFVEKPREPPLLEKKKERKERAFQGRGVINSLFRYPVEILRARRPPLLQSDDKERGEEERWIVREIWRRKRRLPPLVEDRFVLENSGHRVSFFFNGSVLFFFFSLFSLSSKVRLRGEGTRLFLIRSSQIVKRFLKYFRISFVYSEGVGERDKRGNEILKSLFIY